MTRREALAEITTHYESARRFGRRAESSSSTRVIVWWPSQRWSVTPVKVGFSRPTHDPHLPRRGERRPGFRRKP